MITTLEVREVANHDLSASTRQRAAGFFADRPDFTDPLIRNLPISSLSLALAENSCN